MRLLTDCRAAFRGDSALATTELLHRLKADPEAPWGEYGPNGMSGKKLAAMLTEFGIRSGNIRFGDGAQAKGYHRADFTDAWTRYCPGPIGAVPDGENNAGPPPLGGVSVPSVPSSFPQVNAGRIETVGRIIRPSKSIRPSLTRQNDLGTDGTDTPLSTDHARTG